MMMMKYALYNILNDPDKINNKWPLMGKVMNPLKRSLIKKPLDVGVRVINALLTVGQGQRLGIIAGSGVGKSVLLGMMSKYTEADVVVIALIGERAREVGAMVNELFKDEASKKITVVAVPADRSPLMRIRAANRATAIAEYFRDQNKNVLLIMDSLTRIAHAKREIGLSLGETATSKGYPASVISMIPNLIERTGTSDKGQGSITSFYTILADGDDNNDPVVDTARAILDGHIVLSRLNAQMGIYPAVDISHSISRVMDDLISADHLEASKLFRKHISSYIENKDLLLMGGYTQGQDKDLDDAISMCPKLIEFISQTNNKKASYESAKTELLKTSENPTIADASINPNITSQIPLGAPGGECQSNAIPSTNKADVIPINSFRFPFMSVIDPRTGLKRAIAKPEIVCVRVSF